MDRKPAKRLRPSSLLTVERKLRPLEPQHSLGSSGAEFTDITGSIKSPADDANASLNGGLNDDRLTSLFDHLDQLTQNSNSPVNGVAFNTPADHVVNVPAPDLLNVPSQGMPPGAVISDARGAGGGGGSHGGGGGTTPSPY